MSVLSLAASDRGIVVFKLFPSIGYGARMALAFGLIGLGLAVQWVSGTVWIGGAVLFLGNLLLLVSGYDNRVDFGNYKPDAQWQAVERGRLGELKELERQIKRWDRSALDISNWLGFLVFAAVVAGIVIWAGNAEGMEQLLAIDLGLLLVPHWVTGTRSVLLLPGLMIKIKTIETLLKKLDPERFGDSVELLMLLQGKGEQNLPQDMKLKVMPPQRHPEFLGLYGQVVLNTVQGTSYPYFYVVLVARKGFGLEKAFEGLQPPAEVVKELKMEGEAEVIVIRQRTTRTSGYHTDDKRTREIFQAGLALMREVGSGPVPV